jgi:hypothetical protein
MVIKKRQLMRGGVKNLLKLLAALDSQSDAVGSLILLSFLSYLLLWGLDWGLD